MIRVKSYKQTCIACPAQWEAVTEDDRYLYIRYRWGELSVSIGQSAEEAVNGKEILQKEVGDKLGGDMSFEELIDHTKEIIAWC